MINGRIDRKERLTENKTGAWGTSSQDFLHLSRELFSLSENHALRFDGNVSPYTLAGIPMLFSAFRCLLIELYAGAGGGERNQQVMKTLAESANDIQVFLSIYSPSEDLKHDLGILYEIRHEIIHPAHLPTGSPHNTPAYLNELRTRNILQSTNSSDSDYIWLSQLKSHRLFRWAFEVLESSVLVATEGDVPSLMKEGYRESWAKFRNVNTSCMESLS